MSGGAEQSGAGWSGLQDECCFKGENAWPVDRFSSHPLQYTAALECTSVSGRGCEASVRCEAERGEGRQQG